ncbi:MAG: T9SS type A sorting domain-containing protein, partial [Cytophagaceae bacterium]
MIPVHPAVAFGLVVVAKDPAGNFLVMNPQKQGNDFYVDVNNQASYTKYTAIVYRDDINVPNHNSENYDLNVGNSITTGLKAISSSSDIKIYPNPLMDELTVETTGFNGAKMTIMDLFGREVYSGTLQASRELINTSTLGNGIYLLSLKEADKTVFIQKIIVNK